jgi:hypothetical protein
MTGRISLLVSRDLQVLVSAAMSLDREVAKQNRAQTRRVAEPAFREEVRERAMTRIEQRTLNDTARVSVSDVNVLMKSAHIGKVRGTPADKLKGGAEFGASPTTKVTQRSRKGKRYTRRLGPVFRLPRRRGYVVHPAANASIVRIASLWMQTTYRTVAETFEKAGA